MSRDIKELAWKRAVDSDEKSSVVIRGGQVAVLWNANGNGGFVSVSEKCDSAAVRVRAADLYHRSNIGDSPADRLRAAVVYSEAVFHAARRRCGRKP